MIKNKLLATALIVSALAAPASAATLQFTATSVFPNQSSDFSIVFDDLDGDRKLDDGEVISFSGFTNVQLGIDYSELLRISPTPDETDVPLTFTSGGFPIRSWLFGEGGDRSTAQPSSFTYAVSDLTPVPLPASALLLLAGFGGLYGVRRKG